MYKNNIPTLQNAEAQVRLLRARRRKFVEGKRLLSLQLFLTIGVPVVGTLLTLKWRDSLEGLVAFASLVIAVLDVTLLDRLQQNIRQTTAKIQEQFDCTVLDLPWDTFTVGTKTDPETIHEASKKFNRGQPDPTLENWYPLAVGQVPLHLARIICQRTNLWYDSKLRRQYGSWALAVTIGLSLAFMIVGLVENLPLNSFVLTVLAPAAPVLIWGLRECLRQYQAAENLERLKSAAEGLWDDARLGKCGDADCAVKSRQFQNAIYESRRRNPLVFDWIYKLRRANLEDQMNHGAEELVKQVVTA
jgi:SMODS-associating 4TM effector domain